MRKFSKPAVDMADYVLPIELGGTGAATLAGAATSLKLVTNSMKNQPNGPISLGADGKFAAANLPALAGTNQVNIQGSFLVAASEVKTWTITDYDSKKNYNPTVSAGTISQNGATLTYTAPASAVAVTFNIGGRTIQFNVASSIPTQPSIVTPASGSTSVALNTQFTSSAFANTGNADTHGSSDWQLATDSGFTNIVSFTTADTTNKTTWTPPAMSLNTIYYARVRYKGASGSYGPWSSSVSFKTTSLSVIGTEEAKLTQSDKTVSAVFGQGVSLSSDGSRIAVGAINANNASSVATGAVYVFLRTGTTWAQEAKLIPSDGLSGDSFGQSVSISPDASRILIGAFFCKVSAQASAGAAYTFTRSGATWTQEAKIVPSDPTASARFGGNVCLSKDNTRCIIGSVYASGGGAAYVYLRTGTTWALEQRIAAPDGQTSGFGYAVSINSDSTRLLVGAISASYGVVTSGQGCGVVYTRSGVTWTLEAYLQPADAVNGCQVGISVAISDDGTRSFLGSWAVAAESTTLGSVYIYSRSNTTWTQEAKLTSSDNILGDRFGVSVSINTNADRLVVGAYKNKTSGLVTGAAYMFLRAGVNWSQESKLLASDRAGSDQFGLTVSVTSDGSRVAVSAPYAPVSGFSQNGAVYINR